MVFPCADKKQLDVRVPWNIFSRRMWWFDWRVGIPLCAGFHKFHVHGRNDTAFVEKWNRIQGDYMRKMSIKPWIIEAFQNERGTRLTEWHLERVIEHLNTEEAEKCSLTRI